MTWHYVWFSLEGRINRRVYWLFYAVPLMIAELIAIIIDAVAMTSGLYPFPILLVLLVLASFWPGIATVVKRLHDRNRSGWFALFLMVPFANIWILIEVYFLKGTGGPNDFGPDPLAESESA